MLVSKIKKQAKFLLFRKGHFEWKMLCYYYGFVRSLLHIHEVRTYKKLHYKKRAGNFQPFLSFFWLKLEETKRAWGVVESLDKVKKQPLWNEGRNTWKWGGSWVLNPSNCCSVTLCQKFQMLFRLFLRIKALKKCKS